MITVKELQEKLEKQTNDKVLDYATRELSNIFSSLEQNMHYKYHKIYLSSDLYFLDKKTFKSLKYIVKKILKKQGFYSYIVFEEGYVKTDTVIYVFSRRPNIFKKLYYLYF